MFSQRCELGAFGERADVRNSIFTKDQPCELGAFGKCANVRNPIFTKPCRAVYLRK